MGLAKALRIWTRYLRASVMREMQYRAHFFGEMASSLGEAVLFLVFIETVLGQVGAVGEWDRPAMYVLYGTFLVMIGLAHALIQPNLSRLPEHIRRGTLDVLLTKPVDSQFLLSVQQVNVAAFGDVVAGLGLLIYGLQQAGLPGSWGEPGLGAFALRVATYLLLLVCGQAVLYAGWLLTVLWAFWAVRLDNIGVLFEAILQVARYPVTAYPPMLRLALYFVLPLAFVVTVPAQVLLGLAQPPVLVGAVAAAGLSLVIARLGWRWASRLYASASS